MDTLDPVLLAKWSKGEWRNGTPTRIAGFGNDTRSIGQNQIFAAFTTDNRDGHDFLDSAKLKGVSGALVSRFQPTIDMPQLVVADVGAALIEMAARYRSTWSIPVVGITGSCGKTTCKDLLTTMLGTDVTLGTQGNLNNLIGVPISILRPLGQGCKYAVLEAGISGVGEMSELARMIDPDYVIVTAIGPAHLEDLGEVSTVAREKGMLTRGARVKSVFAGESCERYAGYLGGVKVRLVHRRAAVSDEWSFRFESESGRSYLEQRLNGELEGFEYLGSGLGLASNFAVASSVATILGVPPDQLRERSLNWAPSSMRGEWKKIGSADVFLDCYNANPLSMHDSLLTFVSESVADRPRLFLLGGMEELGKSSKRYHEELGNEIPLREQDTLLVMGKDAESVLKGLKDVGRCFENCRMITNVEEARAIIENFEGSLFVKGSRGYRLEDALTSLGNRNADRGGCVSC